MDLRCALCFARRERNTALVHRTRDRLRARRRLLSLAEEGSGLRCRVEAGLEEEELSSNTCQCTWIRMGYEVERIGKARTARVSADFFFEYLTRNRRVLLLMGKVGQNSALDL